MKIFFITSTLVLFFGLHARASCLPEPCYVNQVRVDSCKKLTLKNGVTGAALIGKIVKARTTKCRAGEDKIWPASVYAEDYRKNVKLFFSINETAECRELTGKLVERFSGFTCCDAGPAVGACEAEGLKLSEIPKFLK